MSRRIAVVGAGQAGLPLALSLQEKGYAVTLVSNRTADEIRAGKVMSSQCMFGASLQIEADFGLDWWRADCPPVEGIGLTIPHPERAGHKLVEWAARLERPAQAVDQRLKMPAWMDEFVRRGGELRIQEAGIDDLERLAREHDLTVVAAGKGDITRLFERDAQRSAYDRPQRALALTYVTGMAAHRPFSRVAFNLIPGVGEYFVFPALTATGPCEIMVFEGVPGGPMDCWADVSSPEQHLQRSLSILERFVPWEAQRCRDVALTDPNGILSGRFAPTVRKPVGRLPSGRLVLGMADAVVVNDPITGQGSNNATKCFKVYHDAIVQRGSGAFDGAWMQQTFERYWDYAQWVVRWTNTLLAPPAPHVLELLSAAAASPAIASEIANDFDDPTRYFPWWEDASECARFIDRHAPRAA